MAINDIPRTANRHGSAGHVVDDLNKTIDSLDEYQARMDAWIESDLASSKELFSAGKRKEAIVAFRRLHKNKAILESIAEARFQLIALRIETQLHEETTRQSFAESTNVAKQKLSMQSILNKIGSAVHVSTPNDLTLLRRLARLAAQEAAATK